MKIKTNLRNARIATSAVAACIACSEPVAPAGGGGAVQVDAAAPSFGDGFVPDGKKDSAAPKDAADAVIGDAPPDLDGGNAAETDPDVGGVPDGDPAADLGTDAASPPVEDADSVGQGPEANEEKDAAGPDASKPCTADPECDDGSACTTDTCTAEGCAYQPKNCDDGLPCTADGCDKTTGNCKHKTLAETCAIEGACYAAAEAQPVNPCKVCDPTASQSAWSDQSGAACDDGNLCTGKDQCNAGTCVGEAKPGCCKADADCAVADVCSTANCDVATGTCQVTPKAGCCVDGPCCDPATHQPKTAGAACGAAVVGTQWQCAGQEVQNRSASAGCTGAGPAACSDAAADQVWSPWATVKSCGSNEKCQATGTTSATCVVLAPLECATNADCDDKNPCTDGVCTNGKCSHLAKKCTATTSCQVPYCDSKTGQCAVKWLAGTCEIGGNCMVSGVKNPADACMSCQPTVAQDKWTPLPNCTCAGGVCCNNGIVKPAGTACASATLATEYGCGADGKTQRKRIAYAGCTGGTAICSSASTYYAWQPWTDLGACKDTEACDATDKTKPPLCKAIDPVCAQQDPYEADGTSLAKAHDVGTFGDATASKALTPVVLMGSASDVDVVQWTVTDDANNYAPQLGVTWSSAQNVKVCVYARCTAGAGGKDCQSLVCPTGSQNATSATVSAAAVNGCCMSGTKGAIALAPKPSSGTNATHVAYLEVTNGTPACTQVAATLSFGTPTATVCKAGVDTCCEANGTWSPKGKACGTLTVASEYKCETDLPGGKVLVRKATSGCTGSSTLCSAASANYAWGAWTTYKACLASEMCSVTSTSSPGTCKPATQCVAGSQCCTATGTFAPTGTLCGKGASVEYQCSGSDIQVRKNFSTCAGTSTGCFGTSAYSPWTTVSACPVGQTCTAGASKSTLPTCKAAGPDLCKQTDKWEGTETTSASFDLGVYSDSANAVFVDPAVLLQSPTDKDYLKYSITDDVNFYDPEVYVTWTALKPVKVCAYYRCNNGTSGTDCYDVTCPIGADTYQNTAVSGAKANGCCKTAASGTLSYFPDAPNSMDETGTVFVNVTNADTPCQSVSLKLAFGASTQTKCSPGNTCCTNKGTYAANGTACGSATKAQYRCTTVGGVNQAQKQTSVGSCSGTSATCNTTTTNWGPWALETPCIGPEFCAVGLPTSIAQCVAGKPGSCAGSCGKQSKDGCFCDGSCITLGDCCKDFAALCSGTCDGACGGMGKIGGCMCDAQCSAAGDCCLDKNVKCP
ncbi:MAG: hypothetical protein FJ100_01975 [Deltaproteobacteria bacterium]|nr:hypothetical protein [Deltaproteobacteria bacterium]